jgi:hypothetical protein
LLVALLALAVTALGFLPVEAEARSGYLRAAKRAVGKTQLWWNKSRHWYSSTLHGGNTASLWGIVPLFEALNGLAVAQPSARHRHQLNRFAYGAQRYLNPNLEPVPGFGPKPRQREAGKTTWFDDNGWWGLAFLDAYQATGNPRWLVDAQIAQSFISVSGWDMTPGRPGGIWWNTNHSFYAGESLAGGTLLSARLYELTHDQRYLDDALKFIAWADVWLTDPETGLYARLRQPKTYGPVPAAPGSGPGAVAASADARALDANPDQAAKLEASGEVAPTARGARAAKRNYPSFASVPMPYVNGPMILADRIICEQTGQASYCQRAEELAAKTIAVYSHFWMGPQYDFWYARTMLEFARRDQTADWAGILRQNALMALHRAGGRHGLYLRTWYGKGAHHAGAPATSLQLHAANAALFAWMAAFGS